MLARTRALALVILAAFAVAAAPAPQAVAAPSDVVYITRTGDKFHRDGCRYLRTSKIKVTREEAEKTGKQPCSVCKP